MATLLESVNLGTCKPFCVVRHEALHNFIYRLDSDSHKPTLTVLRRAA